MDEILWLLEQTMRDLQNARRRAGSKRVRAHLRLAIAHIGSMRRRAPASHRSLHLSNG